MIPPKRITQHLSACFLLKIQLLMQNSKSFFIHFQRRFRRLHIGPRQISRPQVDAAVIAGDRHQHPGLLAVPQEHEQGKARRAVGFAVIRHPFGDRVSRDTEGESDMVRPAVAPLHFLDQGARLGIAGNRGDRPDEHRFFDGDFRPEVQGVFSR